MSDEVSVIPVTADPTGSSCTLLFKTFEAQMESNLKMSGAASANKWDEAAPQIALFTGSGICAMAQGSMVPFRLCWMIGDKMRQGITWYQQKIWLDVIRGSSLHCPWMIPGHEAQRYSTGIQKLRPSCDECVKMFSQQHCCTKKGLLWWPSDWSLVQNFGEAPKIATQKMDGIWILNIVPY